MKLNFRPRRQGYPFAGRGLWQLSPGSGQGGFMTELKTVIKRPCPGELADADCAAANCPPAVGKGFYDGT